jgi:thiol-disulfide isomerase/thioredoxin
MSKSLRFSPFVVLALAGLAGLPGCKEEDDAPPPAVDAGIAVDLGGGGGGGDLSCQSRVPTDGFATRVGSKFRPLTLNTCDGTPYDIYNEDFCSSRLTVLGIAAGWCGPCIYESEQLPALQAEYEPQGVRIIQVMYQDEDYRAASNAYCQAWVDRFGLTNVELNDPAQKTQIYFPDGALPSTVIIDSTGTIVYRENGASSNLSSLRTKLDELLAGP